MLAAVLQLLSIITYSLYDYTVMIQLAPWLSLRIPQKRSMSRSLRMMWKCKKKKDFSSSRNSSRLSPVQLLRYWTSANELERVVGWSIRVDEDEARDLATARLPHGSFNNSRVGGGGQLGATDIDLTQTSEWQPNLSEEALWMKNCIKYKTMQRNDKRLRKSRCNMEFRSVSVHNVHLNLRLSATVIRVTFVPNPWALGFLNLASQWA